MTGLNIPFEQAQKQTIQYILKQIAKLKDESDIHKHNIRRHEEGLRLKGRIRDYQEYAEDAE